NSAARIARNANESAKIYHGGVKFSRRARRRDLRRDLPQFSSTGRGIDRLAQIKKTRENARSVGLNDRSRAIVGKNCDRIRGVAADAWQQLQLLWIIRHFATELLNDQFCCPVKITGPRVIAESLPGTKDL